MTLYAESSAVLAWLLGERQAADVREQLAAADLIVSSDLTLIECDRALIRAVSLGELGEAEAAGRRAELTTAAAHWSVLRIAGEIVDRARRPFPDEPVRTPDALHLASALAAKAAVGDLALLSLDSGIRKNGRRLGFALAPAGGPGDAN